ncbi:hypothetical protein EHEL_020320 [Encephalitozoon hellem ATCC 50504]|uniref:XPG-I domain-containing protein n=1 Tax=Encephalitozoon hellem TaxID=27973 RepID=A0A9Q9C6Z7_ENCHE|nr:uncharacterized protein EHEL_020320 [Encephalitozoon hellem ATCC 50504]AFM97790.1 hypothetical protein EHEL_020320 [Encephalitozoon hellem ATCC 50504]UTX42560.1 hypothetical protein GPU96_02g02700 [Encephalitozoon hellem]|eukprot:XP_003886771.1 hypothetical protein EHEL_020320 [Encephalitozoon hellem ATCC 50504]
MPIRGLEEVRKHPGQNFFLKVPQKAFKKMRICIDGNWFLRKYVDVSSIHRGFVFGIEEVVKAPLSKLLEFRDENEVDLIWVWDGIDLNKFQGTPHVDSSTLLSEGLKEYKQKNYRKAGKLWRNFIMQKSEMDVVNRILEENGVAVITAPYSATAQCAYLMSAEACSYAFGKSDVLLFDGVDKIILDMSDGSGKPYLDVFHKSRFLEFFNLNSRMFSALGLLLGCDFCPTMPKCATDFSFNSVFSLIKGSEDLLKMIKSTCDEGSCRKYMDQFLRGLTLVTYIPVMKISGNVQPYLEEHVPRNLEKLLGGKLAPGFYESLFMNKISGDVLEIMTKIKGIDKDSQLIRMVESALSRVRSDVRKEREPKNECNKEKLFAAVIYPDMVLTEDIDASVGILLLMSIGLGDLERPYVPKILCLNNQTAVNLSLDISEKTLKYYVNTTRLFNYIKEVKEVYEVMTDESLDGLFCQAPALFSSSFHEAFGFSESSGKSNRKFLASIRDFLRSNGKLFPIIHEITEEIDATLNKK